MSRSKLFCISIVVGLKLLVFEHFYPLQRFEKNVFFRWRHKILLCHSLYGSCTMSRTVITKDHQQMAHRRAFALRHYGPASNTRVLDEEVKAFKKIVEPNGEHTPLTVLHNFVKCKKSSSCVQQLSSTSIVDDLTKHQKIFTWVKTSLLRCLFNYVLCLSWTWWMFRRAISYNFCCSYKNQQQAPGKNQNFLLHSQCIRMLVGMSCARRSWEKKRWEYVGVVSRAVACCKKSSRYKSLSSLLLCWNKRTKN